ncbi:uncharacterized protein A4U43_C04F5490 [Asparagus officinalis]|uniref:NADPH oxidase Respiratory burst domain-containing protein n=1 Tax=Asparagus officinalis TaxID=4686 RepID=A0A5P1EYJ5_ASPOF|nr:uncharacterized protein A4U43_C04F5490 [Asparagus officinalis]
MGSEHEYDDVPLTNSRDPDLDNNRIHQSGSDPSAFSTGRPPRPPRGSSSRSFARILTSGSSKTSVKARMKRTVSSAQGGIQGLRFLDKAGGREGDGWRAVEKRFDQCAIEGRLQKDDFGRCISEFCSSWFSSCMFV